MDYQRGKAACEIFAEDMAADLTGDPNEIEGMQFFNEDTLEFMNELYKNILE